MLEEGFERKSKHPGWSHRVQNVGSESKGEWERWLFLKEAEKNGQISDLRRQVKYTLIPTQYRTEIVQLKTKTKEVRRVAEHEISYKADFVYEKDGEMQNAGEQTAE